MLPLKGHIHHNTKLNLWLSLGEAACVSHRAVRIPLVILSLTDGSQIQLKKKKRECKGLQREYISVHYPYTYNQQNVNISNIHSICLTDTIQAEMLI